VIRRAFVALGASGLVAYPRIARATGGLDIADPEPDVSIRVLLAAGPFAAPQPIDAWHFAWDGRTYRGTFTTVALEDGRDGLLNVLPLDAYLAGVINREMPAGWPSEAQRAQAIVSRTYVLGRLRPAKSYDVAASESDQKYGGIEGETLAGKAAVDATSGAILSYAGAPAHVAYSSCCGGRTAAAGDVWNTPFPYLTSVDDPHCATSPGYEWTVDVGASAVARAFGASFADIGDLRSVELHATAPDARPDAIVFVGNRSSFSTTPTVFRSAIGTMLVRSTFVRSIALGNRAALVSIIGTGHGHGVGLCQWGARQYAQDGALASDILAFYFPGTRISRA
jgi:stage II sporulation protein D